MSPAAIPTGAFPRSRRLSLVIAALAGLMLGACGTAPEARPIPSAPPEPAAPRVERSSFDRLAGWGEVDARGALNAFLQSCRRIEARSDDAPMSPTAAYAGRVADWRDVCLEAAFLAPTQPENAAARAFFERNFQPLRWGPTGRLTGYYEPYLEVRERPDNEFSMAIRARPGDLLTGDLGQFIAGLEGQRVMGRAADQRFEPYRSRAEIEALNLGVPLAWGRPIDVFFLQIQGSGRLIYPDGGQARVRFAAHNGRPYVSIGRLLIERGELSPHAASKQDIKNWLRARGPQAWRPLFDENPRYVFFSLDVLDDPNLGPAGAQGAALTPMASLAVDPQHHAWGVPVFLTADLPGEPGWTGLVVTQDAGGAITGSARGDLFYGWGDASGERAGRQNDPDARWVVLLPKALAARIN